MQQLRVQWIILQMDLRTWKERRALDIARALPRWLRYWVTIDSIAKATIGQYDNTDPTTLPAMKVLDRL